MKLEPDLLKEILVWCEDTLPEDEKTFSASELEFKGYTQKQIVFHTKLLYKNGYLEGDISTNISNDFADFDFDCLTMNGYQYLNLLRSKAWNIAKGLVHEMGVIFAEAAIKAIIDKYGVGLLP